MESSEDDAGTATSASRRETAREKDLGRLQDVDATSSIQQDTSEHRTSCQTPAMSEDNFDGDSVPSPSTHDVNTSTEAILDMIDEIVDGPGAPKRLPLLLDTDAETVVTSCNNQNAPHLESASHKLASGVGTCSNSKNHHSENENLECDTKCTLNSQNKVICIQSDPCDNVKSSHTDNININIKHQNAEISENSEHGLSVFSDNCESVVTDKSHVNVVSESNTCVNTNTELEAGVASEGGQSSYTESASISMCAVEQPVAPECENIISSNITSLERDIDTPKNKEYHVNIQEQSEPIVCDVGTNVASNSDQLLDSARHCLQKEETRTEDLLNSCGVSEDEGQSSLIERECNSQSILNLANPNILMESNQSVEIYSNLETSTGHTISAVQSKSIETNDSPKNPHIESSIIKADNLLSKNAPVLEQSSTLVTVPTVSNLVYDTFGDNISNIECIPTTHAIKSIEISQNIQNIKVPKPQVEGDASVLDPLVSTPSHSLAKLEENIKTVLSSVQQASSSESLSNPLPSIPSSSVNKTEERMPIEVTDRLKCITTSDKRDIVVVESAESTSSESSASEVKSSSVESMTRTPLRRRLVRPALTRPDSTVSSTVDSSAASHTPEQSSECIKDVSSSSDAVITVQDSDKAEEVRCVSEISICKAETSSPTKKIRLIRRKHDVQTTSTQLDKHGLMRESEECESTSSCEEKSTERNEKVSQVCVSSQVKDNVDNKTVEVLVMTDSGSIETSNDGLKPSSSLNNPEVSRDDKEYGRVPPLKLHISNENKLLETHEHSKGESSAYNIELKEEKLNELERTVPKLTIKVNNTPCDKPDLKSPIPKLTIKTLKVPSIEEDDKKSEEKQFKANITKLNIKPILKPPEKINVIHRKSSSSEISESEYSENDDSTSTSDPASASEQGPLEIVPKVTIKLGKPGTDSEGKFYMEPNIPKLTIKGIQNSNDEGRESPSKLKLVVCQSEEQQMEKVPKLTIKSVSILETQPLSPKLSIKSLKPPDGLSRDIISEDNPPIPKLIISTDLSNSDLKDLSHVHKVTIKPVIKPDTEPFGKTLKKTISENLENIPVITKLNIKPVIKPDNNLEVFNKLDDKVPVVSKINIKPIIKPNDVDFCKEDNIPKITKLNIKPIKSPDGNSSTDTDYQDINIDETKPIITKLNIKPILNPEDEDISKESENHSSENSSDDNNDNIPVVTKINIKPICKPSEFEEAEPCYLSRDENIPVVPKLIIKPLVKPDQPGPQSPKKERTSTPDLRNQSIPVVTKLNIKPIVKPDETPPKIEDFEDNGVKNPPLLMKINRKTRSDSGSDTQYHIDKGTDQYNNIHHNIPVPSNLNVKPNLKETEDVCNVHESLERSNYAQNDYQRDKQSLVPMGALCKVSPPVRQANWKDMRMNHKGDIGNQSEETSNRVPSKDLNQANMDMKGLQEKADVIINFQISNKKSTIDEELTQRQKSQPSNTNCTLLKKLLENRMHDNSSLNNDISPHTSNCISPIQTVDTSTNDVCDIQEIIDLCKPSDDKRESSSPKLKIRSMHDLCKEVSESVTKPLEISISDKINQCSDQDSPRIILKINKTDHGASAKIITDDIIHKNENKSVSPSDSMMINRRRPILLGRKKQESESAEAMSEGKRLRSSRIVQSPEKSPFLKKNTAKRPSNMDSSSSPPSPKEAELSVLDSKRLKLGQLLSSNTLTITPVIVSKTSQISPTDSLEVKQAKVNHSLLNNENCSKNGSSKLHSILSNLQAKQQLKVIPLSDVHSERKHCDSTELKSSGTMLDSNPHIQMENPVNQNCDDIRETIFQESVESRDYNVTPDPLSQDPLEVGTLKVSSDISAELTDKIPTIVDMTPQPKKRGRPRKLPVSEGGKPLVLPTPALEERPQRSLRLSRDRPVIIVKPRGRGRGRGRRMDPEQMPQEPEAVDTANKFFDDKNEEIDPTSSRIKLPRMTEALDKMPSSCATPLTSRRRTSSSSTSDMLFYTTETPELKGALETSLPRMEDPFSKSPEMLGRGGRGGRGSRGRGRASPRTPRGRGRGRGGGRGAMYMKETMGIYGRVCGPATTTVQLFEEETCMMDDNATPAKPSHLLDEDSQSSVKSSTNESSKAKKSKFADLFDSNKVWSASDVKEYTWPPPGKTDTPEHQVMMIQEQVAMFLGVKSFKRRYPELKRRAISAQERDYVLSKGIVTEALCDLGITAVDASEVLDIMLSDYPHKYEEYRSYQREKQLSDPTPEPTAKEVKMDFKASDKPEPPKVDPEKTRLIMAATAIASASEWNTRMNALRRPACVDLQTLTIQRRRAPMPSNPQIRVTPPHGFYPHALLPGQYQHTYRGYTSEQLRYFPLNTVVAAPPAPPSPQVSSSESEPDWSHASSSDSEDTHRLHKRKKLTKVKRSSETEVNSARVEEPEVDTCRTCKLRLEANRKTTHERFLVCATCNAKLHPGCVDLPPDTIRKCREYAWQCAECKTCCSCARRADGKMMYCDLCDRGHHVYCLGLQRVPDGRWHCAECAVCKSCGARSPSGPLVPGSDPASGPHGSVTEPGGPHWHHQTRRGPGGHKVYSHSLCTPCARLR